jgi:hypothetical protein
MLYELPLESSIVFFFASVLAIVFGMNGCDSFAISFNCLQWVPTAHL